MDVNTVLTGLKNITIKKGYAINVSSFDNEVAVSIFNKKRVKRFKNINSDTLLSQVTRYLQA